MSSYHSGKIRLPTIKDIFFFNVYVASRTKEYTDINFNDATLKGRLILSRWEKTFNKAEPEGRLDAHIVVIKIVLVEKAVW